MNCILCLAAGVTTTNDPVCGPPHVLPLCEEHEILLNAATTYRGDFGFRISYCYHCREPLQGDDLVWVADLPRRDGEPENGFNHCMHRECRQVRLRFGLRA